METNLMQLITVMRRILSPNLMHISQQEACGQIYKIHLFCYLFIYLLVLKLEG